MSSEFYRCSVGTAGVVFDLDKRCISGTDLRRCPTGYPDGDGPKQHYWYPDQMSDDCGATTDTYAGGMVPR